MLKLGNLLFYLRQVLLYDRQCIRAGAIRICRKSNQFADIV
ncbi:hypothetical protein ALP92_200079 [Pseudomonas syringae pv. primulae]|uniref:Uncharacterized protein n=1 Tax=Pseudomonas syringae pv. primulae TaxID=251707 RepID=A0A3M4RRK3_9PSED|nr:hypothetical protein ALP92_200079 [Pseudomonas syringae pv. primulae]